MSKSLPVPESPHLLQVEEVFRVLTSSEDGLTADEAQKRLEHFGTNELPVTPPTPGWKIFLRQFSNVLIYVLLASAVISVGLQHMVDAGVIVGVVIINGIVGFIQEGRAETALHAIMAMTRTHCMAVRDGSLTSLDSAELVPGDIVTLQAGDKVPADLRLYFCKSLRCDESALTGESAAVDKDLAIPPADSVPADRRNMAFMGTMVIYGAARGIVCRTGVQTEIGSISELVQRARIPQTPLQRQLSRFARQLTLIIIAVAGLCVTFGALFRHYAFGDMFQAAISIAVASIPEGLPAIVTIALAIGVQRMSAQNALVRRLPSVEVLGSVDVICTDKTGTLTTNEMTARELVTAAGHYIVSGEGYRPEGAFRDSGSHQLLTLGHDPLVNRACLLAMLCNDASIRQRDGSWELSGDPTEGALLVLAMKDGLGRELTRQEWPRTDEIPFQSEHRYMATLHGGSDGGAQPLLAVKGSPDLILEFCDTQLSAGQIQMLDRNYWELKIADLSSRGMRIMALAERTLPAGTMTLEHAMVYRQLTLVGLVGINDPPRHDAIASIRACHDAGIRVKMITGDYPLTASSIGRELGLDTREVLTGAQLDAMTGEALKTAIGNVDIFARTSPANKIMLVENLQQAGHVVAMTGDGVNDAPALRQADIGVAMGKKGTDAAREASSIVLLDDRFSTIATAVVEGRTVYDNIVKSIIYILPNSIAEALVIVLAIIAGVVLPITPAQILWVNMVTTVTLDLALAFEMPEPGIMRRPPRARGASLISAVFFFRMIVVGLVSSLIIFSLFSWYLGQGASLELSRTIVINTLVVIEIYYVLNCRFLDQVIFSRQFFRGALPSMISISLAILLQLLFTYLPPSQRIFGLEGLGARDWVIVIVAALPVLLVVEAEKFVRRSHRHSRHHALAGN